MWPAPMTLIFNPLNTDFSFTPPPPLEATQSPQRIALKLKILKEGVGSRSSPKQPAADADHIRTLFDGHLKVVTHSHRKVFHLKILPDFKRLAHAEDIL